MFLYFLKNANETCSKKSSYVNHSRINIKFDLLFKQKNDTSQILMSYEEENKTIIMPQLHCQPAYQIFINGEHHSTVW